MKERSASGGAVASATAAAFFINKSLPVCQCIVGVVVFYLPSFGVRLPRQYPFPKLYRITMYNVENFITRNGNGEGSSQLSGGSRAHSFPPSSQLPSNKMWTFNNIKFLFFIRFIHFHSFSIRYDWIRNCTFIRTIHTYRSASFIYIKFIKEQSGYPKQIG